MIIQIMVIMFLRILVFVSYAFNLCQTWKHHLGVFGLLVGYDFGLNVCGQAIGFVEKWLWQIMF